MDKARLRRLWALVAVMFFVAGALLLLVSDSSASGWPFLALGFVFTVFAFTGTGASDDQDRTP